jgi:effector-binding domain-containing protein
MIATEIEFSEVQVPSALAVQVPGRSGPDPASIGAAIKTAFGTLAGLLGRHSLVPAGPPRVIYNSYGAEGVSFTLAMPVAAPSRPANDPSLALKTLDGTKAYRFAHHGPYSNLPHTYGQITGFMKSKGWMQTDSDWARYMPMWEEYLNDPEKTPETDLLTYIYLPVA